MTDYAKPLPFIHDETRTYWEKLKAHQLWLPKCEDCNRLIFYPRSFCPHCFSENTRWVQLSGRGTVYSFTISHRAGDKSFAEDTPYNIVLVDLDEGVRLMSNLVECRDEDIRIGMEVEIAFDDVTPEVTLPKFRPSKNISND